MKIIFYVAGMPFNGETINSGKSLGGSETAGHYLAKEMAEKGHKVMLFTNIKPEEQGLFDGVEYHCIGTPTEGFPLGENFMKYALNVPHDVLIAQRIPGFFGFRYASKINIWWTHDLALKRSQGQACSQLWNTDLVLGVSNFHADQIKEVYGIEEKVLDILPNGVDLESIQQDKIDIEQKINSKVLVYSSRPERGLANLVKEGGIMEKLFEIDPEIRLIVCGYDNTAPETEQMYNYLWSRCDRLPNVQNMGPLSKDQLYSVMRGAWLHVYPTDFEETSCITAMEEQACGTPFLTTKTGALPETLRFGGYKIVDVPNTIEDAFVYEINKIAKNRNQYEKMHKKALGLSINQTWSGSAEKLEEMIDGVFEKRRESKNTLVKHLVYNSDVFLAEMYAKENNMVEEKEFISRHFGGLLNQRDYEQFYEEVADYNTNLIKNNHSLGDYKRHLSMTRLQTIFELVSKLPKGSKVLDYGCCVGQVTSAMAKRWPDVDFIGTDISKEQLKIASTFATDNNIDNLHFLQLDEALEQTEQFDLVTCSEVLEHVYDPIEFVKTLEPLAKLNGQITFTTPSGPHEAKRWNIQERREHIHHFEEQDIFDMLGHKKDFKCMFIPQEEKTQFGDVLGNYAYHWTRTEDLSINKIDYERKLKYTAPAYESLSVCMIVKPDGDSLAKTLGTVQDIADEVIIGIDGNEQSKGRAFEIAREWGATVFYMDSPLEIGFDAARNKTIQYAQKDWILWIDDDETFHWPEKLKKYLRYNQYDALAIHQHHFSADPAGVIKTDLPCRFFRNKQGINFFGVVHEHPEKKMNEGAGNVFLLSDKESAICHNGYDTEDRRRERFQRNFPLMERDREKFPDRNLGLFLWIRDLTHLNRFEYMQTQVVSESMVGRSYEVIDTWRLLIEKNQVRMVLDSMEYKSECVDLITQGRGIIYEFGVGASKMGVGDVLNGSAVPTTRGKFLNREDVEVFSSMLTKEKLDIIEHKYI